MSMRSIGSGLVAVALVASFMGAAVGAGAAPLFPSMNKTDTCVLDKVNQTKRGDSNVRGTIIDITQYKADCKAANSGMEPSFYAHTNVAPLVTK